MSSAKITVVGLGPAGAEYLTVETVELLESGASVWLRTARHPAADGLTVTGSFDSLYESLDSFEQVYSTIVSELLELARTEESVVYAVPGSPAVAEHTVELLRDHDAVTSGEVLLDVRPAMAFTDLCWGALGIDPMAHAVTIIDALSLSVQGVGRVGPLLITQVHSTDVLDDVIGLLDDLDPGTVTILQGLGTMGERVIETPWADLRSTVDPDHLTSLWVPRLSEPLGAAFTRLDDLIRDQRQRAGTADTAESFAELEQSFPEVASSIAAAIGGIVAGEDGAQFDLEDGLASALVLLVRHGRLAAESGWFTVEDLAQVAAVLASQGNQRR